MDSFVTQPIVQYAFAGFCAVLTGIIVWLIKELLKVIRDCNRVIAANTKMIGDNSTAVREQSLLIVDNLKLNRRIHNRLLALRCFAEIADQQDRAESASGGES